MSVNRFREWYASKAGRPLILAHRGDSFHGPENTLEAARLGHEARADGWELDVRLTRDGVPVVIHDDSLLRTTNVARAFEGDPRGQAGYLVADFTFDEIQTLDAGSWFLDPSGGPRSAAAFSTLGHLSPGARASFASGNVRIPSLAEALELTIQLDWMVNVEIKESSHDLYTLVDAVLAEVRASKATDRVTISSFGLDLVALVVAREPEVATGALVSGEVDSSFIASLKMGGVDAIHAPPSGIDPRKSVLPVLVYTVNEAGPDGLAAQLIGGGVAGLFTDDPRSLARLTGITPILSAHLVPFAQSCASSG